MTDKNVFSKPEVSSPAAQKELDKVEKQFNEFNETVQAMTHDRMSQAPKQEVEPQTKLSSKEIEKNNEIYLKPKRTIADVKPFDEKYRAEYNFQKEYVNFIAENREIIGETIEIWTKKFPGQPAEEWNVPVNRPVWGPRYLAERIKECNYHRLSMDESKPIPGQAGGNFSFTGPIVVDSTIQRLDAHPVSQKKSVFMGASGF
ncbi:MAG TPA: hypothetical protein DCP92_24700 [Nitrospiraceae bacterium]|jgi:hypothetical protein|nr:hypothetical protein [Nitrospiraceae bacterium]